MVKIIIKPGRNMTIDIMKGILIVMVVAAHAQAPGHRLIYLFHMSVFFMISGYLYGTVHKNIDIKMLVIKKVRALYIPYVICNFLCMISYLLFPFLFDKALCKKTFDGVIKQILKIVLFRGRCSLSSQTWFLAVLFIVSIGYAVICEILYKLIKKEKSFYLLLCIVGMFSIVIGYILYLNNFNFFQIGTIFSSLAAYCLGNIIRYGSEVSDVNFFENKLSMPMICVWGGYC